MSININCDNAPVTVDGIQYITGGVTLRGGNAGVKLPTVTFYRDNDIIHTYNGSGVINWITDGAKCCSDAEIIIFINMLRASKWQGDNSVIPRKGSYDLEISLFSGGSHYSRKRSYRDRSSQSPNSLRNAVLLDTKRSNSLTSNIYVKNKKILKGGVTVNGSLALSTIDTFLAIRCTLVMIGILLLRVHYGTKTNNNDGAHDERAEWILYNHTPTNKTDLLAPHIRGLQILCGNIINPVGILPISSQTTTVNSKLTTTIRG